MVDWRPKGDSGLPRLYAIYELFWAFVLVNFFLLRHSAESPEQYTLHYHAFHQYLFNSLYALAVLSFLQATRKRPPAAASTIGKAEYCADCEVDVKVDSHHCAVCEQCTLRMRTHCIWVNNCIGQSNYKQLILLLLYATLAGTVYVYLLVAYLWGGKAPDYLQGVTAKLVVYFHCGGILMMWTNCVHLLGLHTLLAINGLALTDLTKGVKIARVPCYKDFVPTNDYDLGTLANLRNYLGCDVLRWGVPLEGCLGPQETHDLRAPDVPSDPALES